MLLYLVSRVVSATGAFLYPTYASYKTLSCRPASETDLERWLMYWSVLGSLLTLEYTAEWTVSWLPFYYPLKTIFLLYLALPHGGGATLIYTTQLRPRLAAHEAEIDAALLRAREAGRTWAQRRARELWAQFSGDTSAAEPRDTAVAASAPTSAPPPALAYPASGPASIAYGLWRTYSSALTAFLQPAPVSPRTENADPPLSPSPPSPPSPPSAAVHASTSALEGPHALHTVRARRRALEAELAALPPSPSPPPHLPRPASSTYLPAQLGDDDRGRYEEIAADEASPAEDGDDISQRRSSGGWWWGRSDGYERLKAE